MFGPVHTAIMAAAAAADELRELLENRRSKARELISRCTKLEDKRLEGAHKLMRKLEAELNFLEHISNPGTPINESQIRSSNLHHLEGVLHVAETIGDVCGLFQSFFYGEHGRLTVDVVASSGSTWVNVIARNTRALQRMLQDEEQFGGRNFIQHAEVFLEASRENIANFAPPSVLFFFCNGVTESFAEALTKLGIRVQGEVYPDGGSESSPHDNRQAMFQPGQPSLCQTTTVMAVNLDITTMIAYVSSLTNGGCGFSFEEDVLNYQAEQERMEPLLPRLKAFLQGKSLFACHSAVKDFKTILATIGGDHEKERARALLETVTVVEDCPSPRSLQLKASSSVKTRSKVVFGTGDFLKATTATANSSFVRGAASQGVKFSVFIHEPRALTELKEKFPSDLCESAPAVNQKCLKNPETQPCDERTLPLH